MHVVLELLAALAGAVAIAHGHRPDAPGHAAEHAVFGVHAVAEEKAQVGREVIDGHAARQIGLNEGEAVGQRERQLADRVGAGFGDVIAADAHRIEVANLVAHEELGDITHHLEAELDREDAGVLALVFFEDVGLHRAAHLRQGVSADRCGLGGARLAAVFEPELVELLVDGGVHEHRKHRGRRAVDGHADRGGGVAQVEARIQHLHVVERGDAHARVADLAVDVGAHIGIVAVKRDRIEGGRQPLGRQPFADQLEAPVGAKRITFAGEHACRILALALEGEGAGGVRKRARHVVKQQPLEQLAVAFVAGQRHLAHTRARQAGGGQCGADLARLRRAGADGLHPLIAGVGLLEFGPLGEQHACVRIEPCFTLRGECSQRGQRFTWRGWALAGQHALR